MKKKISITPFQNLRFKTENYSINESTIQFNCKGHIGWLVHKENPI